MIDIKYMMHNAAGLVEASNIRTRLGTYSLLKEVLGVFKHGAEKHDTIDPAEVQLDHLIAHMEFSELIEEESGLPHRAHAAARALLLFAKLMESDE